MLNYCKRYKVPAELQHEAHLHTCISWFYRMNQKLCAFARRYK